MNIKTENAGAIYLSFLQHVQNTPDKTALIVEDKILTFDELDQAVYYLSRYLKKSGAVTGDYVAVLLPNCVENVVLMLVAAKMSLVLIPFNLGIPTETLISTCDKIHVKHFFVWHALIDQLSKFKTQDTNDRIFLAVGGKADNCLFYDEILDDDKTELFSERMGYPYSKEKCDCPYVICMTSGSTGNPKPIVLSQEIKLKRIAALKTLYQINNDDITLVSTPLYHSLAIRLVLQPLVMGGTCMLMTGFSSSHWLKCILKHQITFTITVSSQLCQIATQLLAHPIKESSLRVLVSSSERLSLELKNTLIKQFQCDLYECYGTSEVAIVSNLKVETNDFINSVGRSVVGVKIKILNDLKQELPCNKIGEISCKTNMAFSSYLNMSEETNKAMHGDYFCTGDFGFVDENGYLYFKGRKKELIISGGINIYPKDIEDVICKLDGILEVAVVPKEDPNLGEVVRAVIVKSKNSELSKTTLRNFCANNLADFQFPREFIFVDSLPKNSLGKVQKHHLVEQLFARSA